MSNVLLHFLVLLFKKNSFAIERKEMKRKTNKNPNLIQRRRRSSEDGKEENRLFERNN